MRVRVHNAELDAYDQGIGRVVEVKSETAVLVRFGGDAENGADDSDEDNDENGASGATVIEPVKNLEIYVDLQETIMGALPLINDFLWQMTLEDIRNT